MEITKEIITSDEFDRIYLSVLKFVENGSDMKESITQTGISRSLFYKRLTKNQRLELYKALKSKSKLGGVLLFKIR